MSSRNMFLLPRATLHSDSEQFLLHILSIFFLGGFACLYFTGVFNDTGPKRCEKSKLFRKVVFWGPFLDQKMLFFSQNLWNPASFNTLSCLQHMYAISSHFQFTYFVLKTVQPSTGVLLTLMFFY